MLEKAAAIRADEVVLDLEDSVPAGRKDEARALVVAAVDEQAWAARAVGVRVNALGTPWGRADIEAVAATERVGSLVVPKVEAAEDIEYAARLAAAGAASRGRPLELQALIETAAGLARANEIARADAGG